MSCCASYNLPSCDCVGSTYQYASLLESYALLIIPLTVNDNESFFIFCNSSWDHAFIHSHVSSLFWSARPVKYLMNSSVSMCHKVVHDSTTQLYTMLINMPLHCSESFFKYVAIDHHIFMFLELNQICLLVYYIFKSNYMSLQQEHWI
jgi:hypothetical protein